MKRKYYAYLHKNDHWVVKHWSNKARFMEILEDGFHKDSNIKGIIMPFEIYKPLENWEKELQEKRIISASKISAKSVKDSPSLLHIKDMINRIDWTKG